MTRSLARPFAALVFATLLAHPVAFAQSKGADLSGVVHDSSGAVLPRATVTDRHLATNHTRQTQTVPVGRSSIEALVGVGAGFEVPWPER